MEGPGGAGTGSWVAKAHQCLCRAKGGFYCYSNRTQCSKGVRIDVRIWMSLRSCWRHQKWSMNDLRSTISSLKCWLSLQIPQPSGASVGCAGQIRPIHKGSPLQLTGLKGSAANILVQQLTFRGLISSHVLQQKRVQHNRWMLCHGWSFYI